MDEPTNWSDNIATCIDRAGEFTGFRDVDAKSEGGNTVNIGDLARGSKRAICVEIPDRDSSTLCSDGFSRCAADS